MQVAVNAGATQHGPHLVISKLAIAMWTEVSEWREGRIVMWTEVGGGNSKGGLRSGPAILVGDSPTPRSPWPSL